MYFIIVNIFFLFFSLFNHINASQASTKQKEINLYFKTANQTIQNISETILKTSQTLQTSLSSDKLKDNVLTIENVSYSTFEKILPAMKLIAQKKSIHSLYDCKKIKSLVNMLNTTHELNIPTLEKMLIQKTAIQLDSLLFKAPAQQAEYLKQINKLQEASLFTQILDQSRHLELTYTTQTTSGIKSSSPDKSIPSAIEKYKIEKDNFNNRYIISDTQSNSIVKKIKNTQNIWEVSSCASNKLFIKYKQNTGVKTFNIEFINLNNENENKKINDISECICNKTKSIYVYIQPSSTLEKIIFFDVINNTETSITAGYNLKFSFFYDEQTDNFIAFKENQKALVQTIYMYTQSQQLKEISLLYALQNISVQFHETNNTILISGLKTNDNRVIFLYNDEIQKIKEIKDKIPSVNLICNFVPGDNKIVYSYYDTKVNSICNQIFNLDNNKEQNLPNNICINPYHPIIYFINHTDPMYKNNDETQKIKEIKDKIPSVNLICNFVPGDNKIVYSYYDTKVNSICNQIFNLDNNKEQNLPNNICINPYHPIIYFINHTDPMYKNDDSSEQNNIYIYDTKQDKKVRFITKNMETKDTILNKLLSKNGKLLIIHSPSNIRVIDTNTIKEIISWKNSEVKNVKWQDNELIVTDNDQKQSYITFHPAENAIVKSETSTQSQITTTTYQSKTNNSQIVETKNPKIISLNCTNQLKTKSSTSNQKFNTYLIGGGITFTLFIALCMRYSELLTKLLFHT